VVGLTRSAALDYARAGIRINAVGAGATETPLVAETTPAKMEEFRSAHPIGRIARPEEIADSVIWLCSDLASNVTGTILMNDDGFTALSPVAVNNERGAESDYLRSPRIIADDGEFRLEGNIPTSLRTSRKLAGFANQTHITSGGAGHEATSHQERHSGASHSSWLKPSLLQRWLPMP